MDLVNVQPDPERGKRIGVEVSDRWDYQSKKKCYSISFTGARFSSSHGIEVDELERLYYKVRWLLQDAGNIPLGPFVYKVVVRLHANYKVKKDRLATHYVIANTEEDVKRRLHDLDYYEGGMSLVSVEKLEPVRRGSRVAVIADPGISGVVKDEVKKPAKPRPTKAEDTDVDEEADDDD